MKMIKILLLAMFVTASLSANKLDKFLDNMSEAQTTILHDTYEKADPFDLKWTMTAMAWQESDFGKNLVGRTTPDYGVFQINIKSFKARYKSKLKGARISYIKNGVPKSRPLNDKDIIKMLVSDYELNFIASLEEIKFWKGVHGEDYNKIWASYNGGWRGNPRYAEAIKYKIRALKRYFNRQG